MQRNRGKQNKTKQNKKKKTNKKERVEISSRKLRYQGNISCKDGTVKDRNGMDLTEAEDIKKRWQEYMEELYKKVTLRPR